MVGRKRKILFLVIVFGCLCSGIYGQFGAPASRYMQTQYFINPAYTGTLNTMAVNVMARKQWVGIDGAPTSYHLSFHTPVNNTMMSIGGGFGVEEFGINKFYTAILSYAYLVRLSEVTFLSLGLNASLANHQLSFKNLALTHANDPFFALPNENATDIDAATGAYLYSRNFFLGCSVSNLLGINKTEVNSEFNQILVQRGYHIVSGVLFQLNEYFAVKPSVWFKYESEGISEHNYGMQLFYKDFAWLGSAYNDRGWVSNVLNFQVNSHVGIAYTFDYAVGSRTINHNNHEISISCLIGSFHKENTNREFGERKVKKGIKSLRVF